MAKTAPVKYQPALPERMPGDPQTPAEVSDSRDQSMAIIRKEIAPQITLDDELFESEERRRWSNEATIALVKEEMEEQNGMNPPREPSPGLDQASVDLIKQEMIGKRRRVVLPGG